MNGCGDVVEIEDNIDLMNVVCVLLGVFGVII